MPTPDIANVVTTHRGVIDVRTYLLEELQRVQAADL